MGKLRYAVVAALALVPVIVPGPADAGIGGGEILLVAKIETPPMGFLGTSSGWSDANVSTACVDAEAPPSGGISASGGCFMRWNAYTVGNCATFNATATGYVELSGVRHDFTMTITTVGALAAVSGTIDDNSGASGPILGVGSIVPDRPGPGSCIDNNQVEWTLAVPLTFGEVHV